MPIRYNPNAMPQFGRAMLAEWLLDPDFTYLNHGTVGAPPARVLRKQQALRDRDRAAAVAVHPARAHRRAAGAVAQQVAASRGGGARRRLSRRASRRSGIRGRMSRRGPTPCFGPSRSIPATKSSSRSSPMVPSRSPRTPSHESVTRRSGPSSCPILFAAGTPSFRRSPRRSHRAPDSSSSITSPRRPRS